jgi:GDP-L-fucose synthase
MLKKNSLIYVAGHSGMVGSSLVRVLKKNNFNNILVISRKDLDLTDQAKTYFFLKKNKPKFIFLAAAKVGGIQANNFYRADFIMENLLVQNNVIIGAFKAGIKDLFFLGSSCIYPKINNVPIKEDRLLADKLEPTNEPYAIAKIAGIKLCESLNAQYKTRFKSLMPTNLYGQGDNYDLKNCHVVPALIKKIHIAKKYKKKNITLWGDGTARRDLLHVDDFSNAAFLFMKKRFKENYLNIGSGSEISITDLAKLIMKVLDYNIDIIYDKKKPNGTLSKILDTTLANRLGWKPLISLKSGIARTYKFFLKSR